MAGRGAGGGPGKSDVHLGAVRGGGPRRSKHPPLRAAGGVSFRPEAGSQHLAFHSRERVLRCIDQYTARQYRHQSGQKEALAFARTSSCTSKTVSRVLYQTVIYLDVPSPVRSSHPGSGRCGGLIAIRKRDPSSLFTQHPCAVPRGSDCAVRGSFPRPAPRGIAFSRRWFPDRYRVTLSAVYLCCTFPEVAFGGRYPLSLPCGARTFLTTGLSAWPRDCLSYSPVYFSGIRRDCQRLAAMRPPHRRKSPGPSAENTGWPAERS